MESVKRKSSGKKSCKLFSKDEMNLLEYCIFSASDRVDRKTKSLFFEDQVRCREKGRFIPRRLTVAFSAEFGRPTCRDDLLLMALMKISKETDFQSQKVHFTRYQLLQILGLSDEGRNYQRIEQGFDRIVGTHLNWINAYWDNKEKSWATRKFNIIDDVELLHRGEYDQRRKRESEPKSFFKWSDVMFESFQAGYIKTVDMDVLLSIQGDVSRRLYRWLDKHFKNPKRRMPIETPLTVLATQKLGFKKAPPSHLARMVEPAIKELAQLGHVHWDALDFVEKDNVVYLQFRPAESKAKRAVDCVGPRRQHKTVQKNLVSELVKRGVSTGSTANCAWPMVDKFPIQKIKRSIAYFDYRNAKSNGCLKAGWLIASIMGEGDGGFVPEDFQTKDELNAKLKQVVKTAREERLAVRKDQESTSRRQAKVTEQVISFRDSHSPEQRVLLEDEALVQEGALFREMFVEERKRGEAGIYHKMLWQKHIMPHD